MQDWGTAAALLTALAALITALGARRESGAKAASIEASALAPLRAELVATRQDLKDTQTSLGLAEDRIAALESELQQLKQQDCDHIEGIRRLSHQLAAQGLVPVYRLSD